MGAAAAAMHAGGTGLGRGSPGWQFHTIAGGHDAMVISPAPLAALLPELGA